MPTSEFTDKVGVVTGAAQGIGRAIAAVLIDRGATVVCADLDGDRAARTAAELTDRGPGTAVGLRCNVTSEEDVAFAARQCADLGGIDFWVNNAGITRDKSLRNMELEDFRTVIDVHLVGGWLGIRAAANYMREARSGAIVNISSTSGKVGNPGQTNYSAAKAGLVGMTKAAAKELGRYGIRVNAVAPGLVRTALIESLSPGLIQGRVAEIPLARIGEPGEVADAVAFLLSERSSYITGEVLQLSGGRHM